MSEKATDRRGFLAENFKAFGRFLAEAVSGTITAAVGSHRYLRPPGALDEAAFLLTCTRCGDCATACPSHVIKFLPASSGAHMGTPYLDPLEGACDLCGKCMPACEPKALLHIADPRMVRMGTAVIDLTTCWAANGSICDLCYQRCPFPDEAIRLTGGQPEVLAAACTGCGLCLYSCVSTPVSIKIEPR